MSDNPTTGPESGTPNPQESKTNDPMVAEILDLLSMRFIPNYPYDEAKRDKLLGIKKGDITGVYEQIIMEAIRIRYKTDTGELSFESGDKTGEYSVIRTWLIRDGETDTTPGKYRILLNYPGNLPTPAQYSKAIDEQYGDSEAKAPEVSEGRQILPERIDPERLKIHGRNVLGIQEKWGQSEFVPNAQGDMKILEAINQFNQKYSPSLVDQLFRKLPVKVVSKE